WALSPIEVAECNLEICANSTRWVFEPLDAVFAQVVTLPIRPPEATLEVFQEAGPPRADGGQRELLRTFRLTRWGYAKTPPPWPVARWWAEGWSERMSWVDWSNAQISKELSERYGHTKN